MYIYTVDSIDYRIQCGEKKRERKKERKEEIIVGLQTGRND